MKKQICFMGITAVLLFSGCGSYVEDGDETIVLQTPVIETAVGTEEEDTGEEAYWEEHLLPVPESLKQMERGTPEWQEEMEEYCKEAAPFWKRIVDRAPLKWGEEIPELGPHEAMASWTMWSYLDQKGNRSLLYSNNAFQLLDLGGTGIITDATDLPYIRTTEFEKEKTEGYHTKIHGIFANGGDGELQYTLRDEEGNIVWEHTQGPGCDQIFCDVELKEGTYTMCTEVKSGNPFPNGATCEYHRFTDEENENAMEEYAQFHGGEQ